MNNITELNELIYVGAKLVCEKIGIPSKSTKKPGWEIRLETQIKTTKTSQNNKNERRWNKQKKGQVTQENINTTWGDKPESAGERRKIKEISKKGKTIQTKQCFPNQRKKILSRIWRRWHDHIPTTGCKRNRTILDENMATKKHNEMLNG